MVQGATPSTRHARHRADADRALGPQPECSPCGAQYQAHAEDMVDDFKSADQTHLAVHGMQEFLHRLPGVQRFTLVV